ncbi:MAG: prolyl oligopeptidase family serine peptidase [Luteitalea sp.]|nr:prolyl oligopeptidase family serine peptidase [Luteitalea sp.]
MHRISPLLVAASFLVCASPVNAQLPPASSEELAELTRLAQSQQSTSHRFDVLEKKIDDVLWHFQLGDVASIDKVRLTSAPVRMENPTGQGAGNPLIIYAYTFIPKSLAASQKAPLLIFVHGGVHGDFDTSNAHIVGELVDQGYIVVAPEYRGSTGYGGSFYNQIDYGGTEIDDTYAARNWAVENLPQVDPKRVGILGWSHGGFHTLFNIFRWPSAYQVAYAGVPVSDLVQRMGYKSQRYRDLFAGFIGKEAVDNPMEYRKRSPVYHADKLQTPLLIHTNSNDEDVNVMEVEHLIAALKAAGKSFESKVYEEAPGGHAFNRLDTKLARESRSEIYAFLEKYLSPGR